MALPVTNNSCVQVYKDLHGAPVEREFSSILTMREAAELCMAKNPQTLYFRMPLPEDKAPEEKVKFEFILTATSFE